MRKARYGERGRELPCPPWVQEPPGSYTSSPIWKLPNPVFLGFYGSLMMSAFVPPVYRAGWLQGDLKTHNQKGWRDESCLGAGERRAGGLRPSPEV